MGQKVGKIWLIGGTGESREIAQIIARDRIPCVITIATSQGKNLYPITPYLTVKIGKLAGEGIQKLCDQEKIIAIVDASHPFAVNISRNAMRIAQQQSIPYLRYERPPLKPNHQVIEVENFETLIQGNFLQNKRVLLTVGYQSLPWFQKWQHQAILYARILPRIESLTVALQAGFTEDRLIAFRPPINEQLEQAIWQQGKMNLFVTKASGKQGGEAIKAQIAEALGIPLMVIKRPAIPYPQQTDKISDIIDFCRQHYLGKNHG